MEKLLGEALSKETSYIIKSCDMKGEPHDQLHLVLVPILEEITDLKDDRKHFRSRKKNNNFKRLNSNLF